MILSNNNSNIKELRNKKNKHDLNSYMDFMVKNKMKEWNHRYPASYLSFQNQNSI